MEELCVSLGFCLDPDSRRQLTEASPTPPAAGGYPGVEAVDAFTDEVIRLEGLDPLTFDGAIRAQVRAVVAKHMGQPLSRPEKDRRRG